MNQNVILTFIAVITLLTWGFVAAIVYDMEGSLGGEEDEKTEEDQDDYGSGDTSDKYFLKIPGVEGDAAEKGHDKWVHVYSYSQGISSPVPGINNTSAHEHITQPFIVTKTIDKSSPKLLQYMLDGKRFNATLDVLRYDPIEEERVFYYQWILVNAKVDSIITDPEYLSVYSDQGSKPPEEEITFIFGKIIWTSPEENFTIEMQGNFPLDDEPVDGDEDDIVILRPEHNPLTTEGGKLDDQIYLRSWNWEIGSPIPPKGLKMNEHSSYEPFTITKAVDRNTAIFYELLSSGETINGTIEFYKGSDPASRSDATVYWRVMFSDASISSIEMLQGDGDRDAASIPLEEITFNWEIMNCTWIEEDISYEITHDEIQEDVDQYTVDMYLTIKDMPDNDNDIGAGATVTFKDIPMYEFNHEISQNIDATTGLPTGNSSHSYVQVIKDVDNSSPLLLKALLSGDTFECSVRFYRIKAERPSPADEQVLEEYKVITFTNASVQSITTLEESMDTAQHKEREHISFCYQKITWTFIDGGITSEDDWESPNV